MNIYQKEIDVSNLPGDIVRGMRYGLLLAVPLWTLFVLLVWAAW